MVKFTHVLRRRNFFLLWIGQIISQLGDRLGQMALIGLVYARAPGSTLEIAKILSFTIIPVFLIGPIAGVYVDRWDRRRTLYICDFLRTILMVIIPIFLFYSRSMILTYFIIFLVFAIGRFFVPAKLAIIPELVDKKELLLANSLVNITGMIAAILGFGASGILVEWLGARSGLYLDSLSFFISALLIFLITARSSKGLDIKKFAKGIVGDIKKSVSQEIKEGVLYFIREKRIRFTAGIIFILWAALGAVYVVLIAFVQEHLGSVTKDLGLLSMFLGAGLFLGSMVYGRFGQRICEYKVIFTSLILSGIMLVVFSLGISNYPSFLVAALLSFSLGLLVSPIMIASNTIIHNVSNNEMLGKTFSSMEIIMHLGFILFMFISGFLAEIYAKTAILVAVGIVFALVGLINLAYYRKISWFN